jgi:hypothetical protein
MASSQAKFTVDPVKYYSLSLLAFFRCKIGNIKQIKNYALELPFYKNGLSQNMCINSTFVTIYTYIKGGKKFFVHLMITIRKVTSNVQSDPRLTTWLNLTAR